VERRLEAELWDKMQYLSRNYYDRMIHAVLEYDCMIDITALKTVLICFTEKTPVLHSSFIDNRLEPYWRIEPYRIEDILTVESNENYLIAMDDFLTQSISSNNNVQYKVAVFFHGGKSTFCMIVNHMCMDGADLKYFLYRICQNYNLYITNGVSPLNIKTGSRAYEKVYSGMSQTEKMIAHKLYKNISSIQRCKFPLTNRSRSDKSFIVRQNIDCDTFQRLHAKGKLLGATINDIILAVYIHSLYEIGNFDPTASITVSCAVDLRRHMNDLESTGLTNHSAYMQCTVPARGRTIFETLSYVVLSATMSKRDKYLGLYGLPLLKKAYRIFPYSVAEQIIRVGYSNPLIGMSNIGILVSEQLSLGNQVPNDGFLTGSVKYKPYVLLSFTSLNNVLNMSMCVHGNDEDRTIVKHFFEVMQKNINVFLTSE
jgi:NRPS condensation-like uncharacterized protein